MDAGCKEFSQIRLTMASWTRKAIVLAAALLCSFYSASAFIMPARLDAGRSLQQGCITASGRGHRQWVVLRYAEAQVGSMQEEMDKLKSLKIKDIKAELDERGVAYGDLLEKAEFMQRLADARIKGITKPAEEPKAEEPAAKAEASGSNRGSASSSAKAEEPAKPKISEAELYEKTLEAVMKMRVSEMKKELELLKVDCRGFFEKGDFAQALARARLDPANRGSDDEDPSEYRTVEVKRMPKADEGQAGGPGAGGPGAGGPRGAPGGGGDPFSSVFNQAGRGGGGGAGGFSSIFDAMQNGGGFGGMGGGMPGMGGVPGLDVQQIMSNPRAMAALQRAQQNPRIMKALQEIARDPAAYARYQNDPEIGSVLKELQSFLRK